MKKTMNLTVGFLLIFFSGVLVAKERRGAHLVITKTDGTEIRGELIAVKQDATLLLEYSSRISGSIGLSEVKKIKIAAGSNTEAGGRLGLLVGGTIGALAGFSIGYNDLEDDPVWNSFRVLGGGLGAAVGGFIGVIAGGLLGGAIGSSIHSYEAFWIEGNSQEQINEILRTLRNQARFPEYQ